MHHSYFVLQSKRTLSSPRLPQRPSSTPAARHARAVGRHKYISSAADFMSRKTVLPRRGRCRDAEKNSPSCRAPLRPRTPATKALTSPWSACSFCVSGPLDCSTWPAACHGGSISLNVPLAGVFNYAIGAGPSLGPHLAVPELMVSLMEPTQRFMSGRQITFARCRSSTRELSSARCLKAAR